VIAEFGGTCDFVEKDCNAPKMHKGYEALKQSHPNIDYLGVCKLVPTRPTQATTTSTSVVPSEGLVEFDSAMPVPLPSPTLIPILLAVPLLVVGLLFLVIARKFFM
jgi:hypothetical protein